MRFLRRNRRALLLWLLGLVAVYLLTPVGPRDGWQPSEDEVILGFAGQGFKHGTTLLTCRRIAGNACLPIFIKDLDTGTIRYEIGQSGNRFGFRGIARDKGLLFIEDDPAFVHVKVTPDMEEARLPDTPCDLHCIDVSTGKDRFTFRAREAKQDGFIHWVVSEDADSTAFLVYSKKKDDSRLEWRDLKDGGIILQMRVDAGRIALSPDGRYLACVRAGQVEIWDKQTKERVAAHRYEEMDDCQTDAMIREIDRMRHGPTRFSHDGRFLLLSDGLVWEWAKGEDGIIERYRSYSADRMAFAPKETILHRLQWETEDPFIESVRFDADRSAEPNRTAFRKGNSNGPMTAFTSIDGEILSVGMVNNRAVEPSRLDRVLAMIPGLGYRIEDRVTVQSIVFNASTLQELGRVEGSIVALSPDRSVAVTVGGKTFDTYSIWNFPPHPSSRLLHIAWVTWSAFFWSCVFSLRFLAARRRRRRLAIG